MANRAKQTSVNGRGAQFPPEADGDFDVVSQADMDTWREKLNERFGIGQGKLKLLDVVQAR